MHPESVPRNYEYRLITRQGEIKDIYHTIITIPGTSHRVSSLVDITSLKTTEKALLESEGRYRSVIETASEAIIIIDADRPY